MNYNEKDVALFDTDGTLIKWVTDETIGDLVDNDKKGMELLELDFYGMKKLAYEIHVHTEFLKSLKARGYFIRVHSGNGAQWARNVVKALKLEDYVDSIETKPAKIIDDKPMDDWAHPIYLGDQ